MIEVDNSTMNKLVVKLNLERSSKNKFLAFEIEVKSEVGFHAIYSIKINYNKILSTKIFYKNNLKQL